jgi:hypothetical protein
MKLQTTNHPFATLFSTVTARLLQSCRHFSNVAPNVGEVACFIIARRHIFGGTGGPQKMACGDEHSGRKVAPLESGVDPSRNPEIGVGDAVRGSISGILSRLKIQKDDL